MVSDDDLIPRVIISDFSGQEYTCFELFSSEGEWHARLAWGLFQEEPWSLAHGWSLRHPNPEATFDLAALAQVEVDDSGYAVGLVNAIVALLERSAASPACEIQIVANIADEDLAAKLTPWYQARAGNSEGLINIFRQKLMSGKRPSMLPSFWWGLTDASAALMAIVMHADIPLNASELSPEERERLDRPEELADLWWAIPKGVTHATGIIVAARTWLLPVGPTSQEAQLVSFVFDRVLPYPPALLLSGTMFEYSMRPDGSRSGRVHQGFGDGPRVTIDFVQEDRQRPGTVRRLEDLPESG